MYRYPNTEYEYAPIKISVIIMRCGNISIYHTLLTNTRGQFI